VAAGADLIVTGDKDLLRLGRYDNVRILKPSDLLGMAEAQATEI
jgi:predicted nucleic acid-binding protein